jgi:protein involved in polysaccharide export with SLBB domain
MKKGMRLFSVVLVALLALPAWAQVSDQQAAAMIGRMQAQGQSAEQIAMALAQSGATEEQLLRLKAKMQNAAREKSAPAEKTKSADSRMRNLPAPVAQPQPKAEDIEAIEKTEVVAAEAAEAAETVKDSLPVFGHNIFSNKSLTFEPRVNIATPENYVLGPGDEVIIDIWGNSQQSVRQTISPDGSIVVEPVGLIRLNGLSVSQARARVRQAFAGVYALDGGTQLNLTLGEIRSIQVHVMGEVVAPGTYTVPSLATLFNVLYNAGGANSIGSLRDIRVNRGGKQVAAVDVYEYLMHGRSDLDITLKDGDVVMVPPYADIVAITGKVKRPMRYEMRDGETMEALLGYAGGFTGDAYTRAVTVERKSGREYSVYNVEEGDFGSFMLADMDNVEVGAMLDRFSNRIEVRGAVFRPGVYALGDGVVTVRDLIAKAEGLRGDAFTRHAVLYRLKNNHVPETLSVDIGAVMRGEAEDIELRRDDVLVVSSIFDLNETRTVTINGEVGLPGTYRWAENMTLEDLVVRAGGLLESASMVRIDVAQRIKDPSSTTEAGTRAIHISFELEDGLMVKGDNRQYLLRPFDEVYVRTSPGYSRQQNVSVDGEVMFAGQYALTSQNERLSELVHKAGGLKKGAYVNGARLTRMKTDLERAREESALGLVRHNTAGRDSLNVESVDLEDEYAVAIQLDKALQHPGSDSDLVLREGDKLYVPEYVGTVLVAGAVIYPNTVAYGNGRNLRHYIGQGGGYANRALKRKTYVIHMNGMVEESRFLCKPKVTPGSMVVVPMKSAARNPMSPAEVVGMTTSVASLGAIVTSLMNMNR